jgi:hypothetical protein
MANFQQQIEKAKQLNKLLLKEILDKKQMYDDRQDIWAGNGILFPT